MMASETVSQTPQKTNASHSVGVRVTTKTESTPIGEGLELNPLHFKTPVGILKIVQLVIAIICMICGSPVITNYARFFMFVVCIFFIITLILCFTRFFSLEKRLTNFPWLIFELGVNSAGAVLYLIAAIVMLSMTTRRDYHYVLSLLDFYTQYVIAGVFAILNTVAYGIGAFLLFQLWNSSRRPTTTPAPNGTAS